MTTALSHGSSDLSTTSRSPDRMPAPSIESPAALTKYVAAGLATSSSLRSSGLSTYCSAGDGNPAMTAPPMKGISTFRAASAACLAPRGTIPHVLLVSVLSFSFMSPPYTPSRPCASQSPRPGPRGRNVGIENHGNRYAGILPARLPGSGKQAKNPMFSIISRQP